MFPNMIRIYWGDTTVISRVTNGSCMWHRKPPAVRTGYYPGLHQGGRTWSRGNSLGGVSSAATRQNRKNHEEHCLTERKKENHCQPLLSWRQDQVICVYNKLVWLCAVQTWRRQVMAALFNGELRDRMKTFRCFRAQTLHESENSSPLL